MGAKVDAASADKAVSKSGQVSAQKEGAVQSAKQSANNAKLKSRNAKAKVAANTAQQEKTAGAVAEQESNLADSEADLKEKKQSQKDDKKQGKESLKQAQSKQKDDRSAEHEDARQAGIEKKAAEADGKEAAEAQQQAQTADKAKGAIAEQGSKLREESQKIQVQQGKVAKTERTIEALKEQVQANVALEATAKSTIAEDKHATSVVKKAEVEKMAKEQSDKQKDASAKQMEQSQGKSMKSEKADELVKEAEIQSVQEENVAKDKAALAVREQSVKDSAEKLKKDKMQKAVEESARAQAKNVGDIEEKKVQTAKKVLAEAQVAMQTSVAAKAKAKAKAKVVKVAEKSLQAPPEQKAQAQAEILDIQKGEKDAKAMAKKAKAKAADTGKKAAVAEVKKKEIQTELNKVQTAKKTAAASGDSAKEVELIKQAAKKESQVEKVAKVASDAATKSEVADDAKDEKLVGTVSKDLSAKEKQGELKAVVNGAKKDVSTSKASMEQAIEKTKEATDTVDAREIKLKEATTPGEKKAAADLLADAKKELNAAESKKQVVAKVVENTVKEVDTASKKTVEKKKEEEVEPPKVVKEEGALEVAKSKEKAAESSASIQEDQAQQAIADAKQVIVGSKSKLEVAKDQAVKFAGKIQKNEKKLESAVVKLKNKQMRAKVAKLGEVQAMKAEVAAIANSQTKAAKKQASEVDLALTNSETQANAVKDDVNNIAKDEIDLKERLKQITAKQQAQAEQKLPAMEAKNSEEEKLRVENEESTKLSAEAKAALAASAAQDSKENNMKLAMKVNFAKQKQNKDYQVKLVAKAKRIQAEYTQAISKDGIVRFEAKKIEETKQLAVQRAELAVVRRKLKDATLLATSSTTNEKKQKRFVITGKERDVASKGDLSIAQTAERKVAKALVDAVGATSETVSVGQPIATSEKKEKMKVKSRQATVKNAGTQLKNSIKAEKTATKNIGRSKYDKTRFTKRKKHQADEEAEQDAKVQSMTTEKGYKNHMKKTADKYARKKVDLQKKIDINQIKSVESRSLLLPEMLKRVENAKIRVDLKTRAGGVARAVAQAVKGIQKQSKEAKIKQETLLQATDDKRSLAKAEEDKVSAQASEIRIDKLVVSNKATSEVVDAKAEQTVKTDVAAKKELTKAKTAKTTEVLKDQGSDKTCDNCQQAEAELAAKDKEISKDKKS